MKEELEEDFRALGLELHATRQQVEKAYAHKLALYAENSLATYALFDEDGRQAQLARLEVACRRIRAAQGGDTGTLPPAAEERGETKGEGAALPDPATSPGRFLRAHRIKADLSLKEIANRTKISSTYLSQIEEERFDLLPAPVYLRGFVLAFARTLGLPDPEGIYRFFLARRQEQP
jgi:cytoskeleton protein RodZ